MRRKEEHDVSDEELSLQSRSSSGEDYDEIEDDLQPPPRVIRPSSCKKRRVSDILKDMNRVINDDNEEELDTLSITATTESSQKKTGKVSEVKKSCKKSGRKAAWSEDILEDLVDCISGDEEFTKKLIFTNVPNGKNALV
eukprot:Seg381.3 transcript_id=Seg381.3/GoldUCD/mRNA.D3Y31 product="hypothetical protein" protein_id=Seg381.3/GoldUCD/D3Y31